MRLLQNKSLKPDGKQKMIKCRKGFSIIELIIVIAIIAVLSTFAVPAFLKYTANANLKSATREITSDILNQKEKAISENRKQRITFSTANESYTLEERNAADTAYENPQTRTLKHFGSNIDITSGYTMTFQTRGTAKNGTIKLANNRGSIATITVNITGRTYVTFSMQ